MSKIDFEKFCRKPKGSKSRYTIDFSLDNYYDYYCATVTYDNFTTKFSKSSTGLIVTDKKQYKNIIKDMIILIVKKLLSNPDSLSLPGLGLFKIEKIKMGFKALAAKKKLKIDYKKSKEAKQIVYHLNEHSNGYYYAIKWYRNTKQNKFLFYYNLRVQQKVKKNLGKQIKTSQYTDFYINDKHKADIQ